PSTPRPPMNAGQEEAAAGNMADLGVLMKRIQQDPGDVAAMLSLAERFVEDKNWAAAESFLRKAVVAAPGNPQPLYLLGVVLHNQGKHAEAAACLERVVNLRDEPSVRYSLGVLYMHYLQDPARGSQHLRAALAEPGLSDDLAKLIRVELDTAGPQAAPPTDTESSAKAAPEKKGVKLPPTP
ncbi:MAG: tetratricopeptide repeat protein, partial [Betaproteobacteria bacterium]|nr:tetratricopeptide repeat protein [Betaproteobacteria bacterium]